MLFFVVSLPLLPLSLPLAMVVLRISSLEGGKEKCALIYFGHTESSSVTLSNGLCFISLAIPELKIQSSKVELSNGLCSNSSAIP